MCATWPCRGRGGSATLGLTAQRHARYKKGHGCSRQRCAGLRLADRVTTAHGVHLASLHTPKQYGAVEQAVGRMVAQPEGASLPGPSAPRRSSGKQSAIVGAGQRVETSAGLRKVPLRMPKQYGAVDHATGAMAAQREGTYVAASGQRKR